MDPRKILDYLTQTLRDANPAVIHVLSKMETTVMDNTIFLALPDSIEKEDMQEIMVAMAGLPVSVTGDLTVKPLYKLNQQFADPATKAVISEALNDISEKCGGELKLLPTKVAYFVLILGNLSEGDKKECRENLQLFGSDRKFHRVIVGWGENDWEIMEFEGGKSAEAPKHQIKPEAKNLTQISELDDPARQRTRAILQDDIMDLQILLGRSGDVLDVIRGLDTIGARNGD